MTIQAQYIGRGETIDWVSDAAYSAGDVIQLRDGRAGVVSVDVESGKPVGIYVRGLFLMQKTTSMLILMGSKLFWDHSADKVHLLHGGDRDFYVGTAQPGGPTHLTTITAGVSGPTIAATAAGTSVMVALNEKPANTLSLADGFHSIPISTAGWPHIYGAGNSVGFKFDLAAEAQKLDALSIRGMAPGSESIVDALVCINLNGDDAAFDLNVGLGNASHATDADSITEYLFVHVDGASLNIMAQSKDGGTTVPAADTTVDAVVGTPFLTQWDLSNLADVQMYVNGVNVLPATVFKLDAAVGPLKLLAHMEKSANDTPGNVTIMDLCARTSQAG